jgi:putative addiction module component (TIGR02574 family)
MRFAKVRLITSSHYTACIAALLFQPSLIEIPMTNPALEKVRSDALRLTDEERAELAHDLVTSLDGRAESNAAQEWDIEVSRRLNEIDSGIATLIDREEFSRRLRERLNRP